MRIQLGNSVLCDGTIENGAQDYQEEEVQSIERVVPARSNKIRLRDRGAKAASISFNVEREFPTVFAAENFWEVHKRETTRFGTMTKTATGDGSERVEASVYAYAALEKMTAKFFGVTCTVYYSIIAEPPVVKKSDI